MTSKRRFLALFLIGVSAWVAGCSVMQPEHVNLEFRPSAAFAGAVEASAVAGTRPVVVAEMTDERTDRETLGSSDAQITGTDVVPWVLQGLELLAELARKVPGAAPSEASARTIAVSIRRVSCRGVCMNLRCTVLLEVEFRVAGDAAFRRNYYGSAVEDKALISGGSAHFGPTAIRRGLNRALEGALLKLAADVRSFSRGEPVTPRDTSD